MYQRSVAIDFFPDSALRYEDYDAIVCIDVLCTTSTLVTAVARGRRALPAASLEEAARIGKNLKTPLFAGELDGTTPRGFELGNSPSAMDGRRDLWRPLVLLSTSGTPLLANARACESVYTACLRNLSATASFVATHHAKVAVLAAGSRRQIRVEDRLAVAWLASQLISLHGFTAPSRDAQELVRRWGAVDPQIIRLGRSADYLRRSARSDDLEFVLSHLDDLDLVCPCLDGEIEAIPVHGSSARPPRVPALRLAPPLTRLETA